MLKLYRTTRLPGGLLQKPVFAFPTRAYKAPKVAKKLGRRPRLSIQTLDPARLRSSDFTDLSLFAGAGGRGAGYTVRFSNDKDVGYPHFVRYGLSQPFPEGTRGFLYFCRTDPTAGEIRLRLTPTNDPTSFSQGSDLIGMDGHIWTIGPGSLAYARSAEGLRMLLLQERLVTKSLLESWASRMPSYNIYAVSRLVSGLSQPFLLDFGGPMNLVLHIGPPRGGTSVLTRHPVCRAQGRSPFTGSGLVAFEPSTLPQHEGRRVLVLRLVKIVEEVKPSHDPAAPQDAPVPVEGELLQYNSSRHGRTTWSIDVMKDTPPSRALRRLWDRGDISARKAPAARTAALH